MYLQSQLALEEEAREQTVESVGNVERKECYWERGKEVCPTAPRQHVGEPACPTVGYTARLRRKVRWWQSLGHMSLRDSGQF